MTTKEHDILPPYLLGYTKEEAEETYKLFDTTLNNLSIKYSINTGISKEDFFSEALMGLAKAVKNRDNRKSVKEFRSYAYDIIVHRLNEYVNKRNTIIHIPSYILKSNQHIKKLKDLLNIDDMYSVLLTKPNKKTEEEYNKLIEYLVGAAEGAKISIEELVKRSEHLPTNATYVEEQTQIETTKELVDTELKITVEELKKRMTEDELTISESIMNGETYEQIGKKLGGITASAVQQKIDKMKEKFRGNDD